MALRLVAASPRPWLREPRSLAWWGRQPVRRLLFPTIRNRGRQRTPLRLHQRQAAIRVGPSPAVAPIVFQIGAGPDWADSRPWEVRSATAAVPLSLPQKRAQRDSYDRRRRDQGPAHLAVLSTSVAPAQTRRGPGALAVAALELAASELIAPALSGSRLAVQRSRQERLVDRAQQVLGRSVRSAGSSAPRGC